MAPLALVSYWLVQSTPAVLEPVRERPVTHGPDHVMQRFSVKVFDAQGALHTEVFGVQARHYAEAGRTEIDQARIRSLHPGGMLTTATAQHTTSNLAQTEFVLRGDAVVIREGGLGADGTPVPRLEFRGELLRVYTEPQRLVSEHPVLLRRGEHLISADSLDYSGESRTADFRGRVRAHFAPPR